MISRARPATSSSRRVSTKRGMPSRTWRKACSRRLSPSPGASVPARSQRRPASSRRGRDTDRPSSRRSTRPISAGTLSDSGRRDQAKRPATRWRPWPTRSRGAPSRSKTGAGEPSRRSSCGQCSALPGRRTSTARSACKSRPKVPPLGPRSSRSWPGQRQTACPCTVAQPRVGTWSSTQGTHGRRLGGSSSRERGWALAVAQATAAAAARVSHRTTDGARRRRTGTSLGAGSGGPQRIRTKDTAYSCHNEEPGPARRRGVRRLGRSLGTRALGGPSGESPHEQALAREVPLVVETGARPALSPARADRHAGAII